MENPGLLLNWGHMVYLVKKKEDEMMQEKDALNLAIEIVEKGSCSDSSLEVTHINRGYQFVKISSNIFHLSIKRHPHIFGRASKGMASSAFAKVETTYELNTDSKTLDKNNEEVLGISIDYSFLAEDEVRNTMESLSDEELQLKNLATEESVKKYAEKKFNEFDFLSVFVADYEHFLEKNWKEKLNNSIKDEFIRAMIEKWEFEKSQ
jgi:hypothetical protein